MTPCKKCQSEHTFNPFASSTVFHNGYEYEVWECRDCGFRSEEEVGIDWSYKLEQLEDDYDSWIYDEGDDQ